MIGVSVLAVAWAAWNGIGASEPSNARAIPNRLARAGESARPALSGEARPGTGDMVRLPAGTFLMGSDDRAEDEKPVHSVTVASFEMDATEVTVRAYRACVESGMCSEAGLGFSCNWHWPNRDDHPVNCVDWYQATTFCAWAGKRLPTEEEWEYAARGRQSREYPWGSKEPTEGLLCAYHDSSIGTCEVASFPAGDTPTGLHDMIGNVWEWTASRYCPYDKPECSEKSRVSRGGGWIYGLPADLCAAIRSWGKPTRRMGILGFRCAR